MTIMTMIYIVFEDSRMIPFSSFCWNRGKVENMRHKVDTTTNIQDTTATTCKFKVSATNQGFFKKNMFYFANTQGEQVTCVRWKSDSGGLLFGRKLTFEMPPQFQIPRVYVQIGFSHSIVGKGTCWPLQRWNSADFQRGSKVFFGWLRTCRLQTLLQRCLPRQQRYWISWY